MKNNNKKHIYLTGMSGVGKTTFGKLLAKNIAYDFLDLDNYIEKKVGQKINAIFDKQGEEVFRNLESQALKELAQLASPAVIATGGGAILSKNNYQLMQNTGLIICLWRKPEAIWADLIKKQGTAKRPLLKNQSKGDFLKLYQKRANIYLKSNDIIIQGNLQEMLKSAKGFIKNQYVK